MSTSSHFRLIAIKAFVALISAGLLSWLTHLSLADTLLLLFFAVAFVANEELLALAQEELKNRPMLSSNPEKKESDEEAQERQMQKRLEYYIYGFNFLRVLFPVAMVLLCLLNYFGTPDFTKEVEVKASVIMAPDPTKPTVVKGRFIVDTTVHVGEPLLMALPQDRRIYVSSAAPILELLISSVHSDFRNYQLVLCAFVIVLLIVTAGHISAMGYSRRKRPSAPSS